MESRETVLVPCQWNIFKDRSWVGSQVFNFGRDPGYFFQGDTVYRSGIVQPQGRSALLSALVKEMKPTPLFWLLLSPPLSSLALDFRTLSACWPVLDLSNPIHPVLSQRLLHPWEERGKQ